jgi:hypothetical protein
MASAQLSAADHVLRSVLRHPEAYLFACVTLCAFARAHARAHALTAGAVSQRAG